MGGGVEEERGKWGWGERRREGGVIGRELWEEEEIWDWGGGGHDIDITSGCM